jgi:hypothetical protein
MNDGHNCAKDSSLSQNVVERPGIPSGAAPLLSPTDAPPRSVFPFCKFGNPFRLAGFWLAIGSALFLTLCLFVFPWIPIWMGGDQSIFLYDVVRMLGGEALYRDFFQMTFPATELVYLGIFNMFGPRTWIPNALLIILGVGFTLLIYLVSRRILRPSHAPIPALAFLTLIFHERFDATHHWFSILAILAALAVLMGRRTKRCIFCAGILCGLAACFTQSHGLIVLFAFCVFF